LNPNAPRIEFFTSDVLWIEPGGSLTLHWSIRGVNNAFIYRLNRDGTRARVWNVGPDGQQRVDTRSSDRGQLDFLLTAGEGDLYVQQSLTIPIRCPVQWFFSPAPDQCPDAEAEPTTITEQIFERGLMVYIASRNTIYVLFNDGREPGWLAFTNRYDPAVHPEIEEDFRPPAGFYQPRAELGLIWRGNDTVRNRLGLGVTEANVFDGLLQVSTEGGAETLYLNSTSGQILQIIPGGDVWQIIALP
jgi:hypothetical protein